jgi:hypothetical protein
LIFFSAGAADAHAAGCQSPLAGTTESCPSLAFICFCLLARNYFAFFLTDSRTKSILPSQVTHKGEGDEKEVCGICHEQCEDPVISACKHVFCREDIKL